MSKNLEELYNTDDLTLIKKLIAELTAKKDYKTLNTLFRRNPHAFDIDPSAERYKRFQSGRYRRDNVKCCYSFNFIR